MTVLRSGVMLAISAFGAAFTLGLATPAHAQEKGWHTITGYPRCIMRGQFDGLDVYIRSDKNAGGRGLSVSIDLDNTSQRYAIYAGSAYFDGGTQFRAREANIVRVLGSLDANLSFDDPAFMRAVKAKKAVVFRVGSESWTVPLTGSSPVATEFMACAGIADASSQQSVKAGSGSTTSRENSTIDPRSAIGQPVSDSIVQKIDTAIYRDSRRWAFNRYNTGSVRDARVTEVAGMRDYTVRAYYTYNNNRRGFVDASFVNGLIDCLRFHDNPTTCKPVRR